MTVYTTNANLLYPPSLTAVLALIRIHMQTVRKSKPTSHESGFTVFKLRESLLISYPHKVNTSFQITQSCP